VVSLPPEEIQDRYRAVRARVDAACEQAGRAPEEVTVVAVGKSHSVASIRAAFEAGCEDFGENRVQEWREKHTQLPRRIRWHFIGPLQRNKVKYLVEEIALLHSLDGESLVEMFERRAESPHEVLIEVNLGAEASKAGVPEAEVESLALRCARSPVVRPVGLMCIPPWSEDPELSRPYFRRMAELLGRVRMRLAEHDELVAQDFTHLSMGMTHDFEVAIHERATLVRVGTAIFGPRPSRLQPAEGT
jgi:pyridoxal phosphate enzyme (YggS family)